MTGERETAAHGEICALESSHIPTRPVPLCFTDPWWLHIRRRKGTRYPARVEKARRRSDTKSSDSTREEVDEGGSSFQWEEEGGGQEQWARMHLIMSASTGAIFQQTQ